MAAPATGCALASAGGFCGAGDAAGCCAACAPASGTWTARHHTDHPASAVAIRTVLMNSSNEQVEARSRRLAACYGASDRKSVVEGKSVDLGGRRIIKK